jgi:hypothetical protein
MKTTFDTFSPDSLEKYRLAILASIKGEVLNTFNKERFGDYTSPEHVEAILQRAGTMKVLLIGHDKSVDPRLLLFIRSGKLQIRFLPVSKYNFATETLITGEKVFIATRTHGSEMISADYAADMRIYFYGLWETAEIYSIM